MIDVRELTPEVVEHVGSRLPLNRLPQQQRSRSTYLIAWDGPEPVGHAHLAWSGTHLGLPELQDVYVQPSHRRRGVASALSAAAEQRARDAGAGAISLSVGHENHAARALYEKLGYVDAGVEPVRVSGTVELRSGPLDVNDTLVYLRKPLSDTMSS